MRSPNRTELSAALAGRLTVFHVTVPREVRTLFDRKAGSKIGLVGDELVAQHGLAAVALGVDVTVH